MKILQLGVGAIGTVAARHLAGHRAVESLTLGDMDTTRAGELARELRGKVSVERIDAADPQALEKAIHGHGLVVSAVLPVHNVAIMKAALASGSHLLDLSTGGGDELAHDAAWKKAGLTAIHGMGEDPGISNVFTRWAADRLDQVDAIRVRDGEYSTSDEFPLACLFSTETFIEEAVSPAIYFEDGKWKEIPAWSNREVYPFPEPVGPQIVYNMNHEEVDTLPRFIGKGVRFVDFKLAVPIKGAAIILVEVDGREGGRAVRHVLHASMTHDEAFRRMKMTATAYLTGTGAAAGALALVEGGVVARGVLTPEMLEPEPILALLQELGVTVHKKKSFL